MRHTTLTTALAVTAGLMLSACTSDVPAPEQSGTDDAARTSAGTTAAGTVPDSGWFCRIIPGEMVETLTDGAVAQARQLMVSNDETSWVCQVNQVSEDGDSYETALELTAGRVDEQTQQAYRTQLQDVQGVSRGPDYTGEGYVTSDMVVALMECNTVPASGEIGNPAPHAFVAEVMTDDDTDRSEQLVDAVRELIVQIDKSVGCYPSEAYEATTAAQD